MVDIDAVTFGVVDSEIAMKPYLEILKNDSSSKNLSTLRSLIIKVLIHPQIYCGFDDFKGHCDVSDSAAANIINRTLDLFSYGTLKEYVNNQQQPSAGEYYLPLNDAALSKLSRLTVLSCIQEACFNGATRISYVALADALGWINEQQQPQDDGWIRNVEDILIESLYANVLKGKLCQKTRTFGWETQDLPVVCSRDVSSAQVSKLLVALKGLEGRLERSGLEVLQAQGQVTQGLEEASRYWKAVQDKRKCAQSDSMHKGSGGAGPSRLYGGAAAAAAAAGGGAPWLDSGRSSTSSRSSKRSRGGLGGNFATETALRM